MAINFNELEEHYDNDIELISDLLEVLEGTLPETMNNLGEAIKNKSDAEVELHAHTLKGMISNFFDAELKDLFFKIEKMGKEKSLIDVEKSFQLASDLIPDFLSQIKGKYQK